MHGAYNFEFISIFFLHRLIMHCTMSQVNNCYSVLFPPPNYLAIIPNRVQLPNVSMAIVIIFAQLDYMATRRTVLRWSSTSKSLVWLSKLDESLEHKISRLEQSWRTIFMILVYCVKLRDRQWDKDTCRIFWQLHPFSDVEGTITYLLHGAESLVS